MKDNKYCLIYINSFDYLNSIKPNSVNLQKYFEPESKSDSIGEVYYRFIFSAQNYQGMPNIIALDKRKKEIRKVLHDFDLEYIKDLDLNNLYMDFRKRFEISSEDTKYNSWYKWANSVIDSARFLYEFKDVSEFNRFVELFDYNILTRAALPLLIKEKINGIGFALACDLLKELGFENYPKPDVHLMDVFSELGLCNRTEMDTYETIVRMSEECKTVFNDETITPYKLDKIIWLICSGKFYLEKPKEIRIGSHKKAFIESLQKIL